jgi:hypothetical protein
LPNTGIFYSKDVASDDLTSLIPDADKNHAESGNMGFVLLASHGCICYGYYVFILFPPPRFWLRTVNSKNNSAACPSELPLLSTVLINGLTVTRCSVLCAPQHKQLFCCLNLSQYLILSKLCPVSSLQLQCYIFLSNVCV